MRHSYRQSILLAALPKTNYTTETNYLQTSARVYIAETLETYIHYDIEC